MKKINFVVTEPQAQVLADALDLYARLSIGQIGMISEMISMNKIPVYSTADKKETFATPDMCEDIRIKVEEIIRILGYSGYGHSLGVGNQRVPIAGHRAYEMSKVLQKTLAEHKNPNPVMRGVNYDGLSLRYTQDPAPIAEIII
jgi:hypothetical protein